jgi:hypothetical protein
MSNDDSAVTATTVYFDGTTSSTTLRTTGARSVRACARASAGGDVARVVVTLASGAVVTFKDGAMLPAGAK